MSSLWTWSCQHRFIKHHWEAYWSWPLSLFLLVKNWGSSVFATGQSWAVENVSRQIDIMSTNEALENTILEWVIQYILCLILMGIEYQHYFFSDHSLQFYNLNKAISLLNSCDIYKITKQEKQTEKVIQNNFKLRKNWICDNDKFNNLITNI